MAAVKKVLGKGKTGKKSRAIASKAVASVPKVTAKRVKKAVQSKPVDDGAEQMRQAADLHVGLNSDTIASALAEKARAGDWASTKALMALAAGKKPKAEKKKAGPTLAEWLAGQPEWENAQKDEKGKSGEAG